MGKSVFEGCEGLTEVEIALADVNAIDDAAFRKCKMIEDGAFQNSNGLRSLSLNDGLERIGDDAFHGCTCLTKVDIPTTVKDIGDKAFVDCTGAMTLVLHEGLERIGKGAFGRCEGLTKVDICHRLSNILMTRHSLIALVR
eukprot:scaffold22475_cov69-Cylindrotheca_fusiformis.AAC.4